MSAEPTRREISDTETALALEWLVTNGLGGYASGSLPGACTRRYHGLLVAALPAPLGRTVMLNHLDEALCLPGGPTVRLSAEEAGAGVLHTPDAEASFALEMGLPVWRWRVGEHVVEKRVLMPSGENTVHVSYRLLQGSAATLLLRPGLHMRGHEDPAAHLAPGEYLLESDGPRLTVRSSGRAELPPLRLCVHGAASALEPQGAGIRPVHHRVEAARGYAHAGELWSPGTLRIPLAAGQGCTLVASTEPWERVLALEPHAALAAERARRADLLARAHPAAREGQAAELVLAADQFIITPSRQHAAAQARGEGGQARTVIAGYHWFTDWGRDTMISLEGLTLATGRHAEAGWILRTFLQHVRDGLIPNLFPEGQAEGLYHTADATLWMFHAMDRYRAHTGDDALLREALPVLRSIIDHHLRGTRFGIGVDPADGLLRQGAPGYQLTWMDAKVDGWVVTPRRGKAVELNALFHNALRLMQQWLGEHGDTAGAQALHAHAQRLAESFNRRFWNPASGCLFDVVDGEQGDDAAIRPNMLLAIALPHPVLDRAHWSAVLEVARRELLTPVGLRSLAPGHPDYKPRYDGDLRTRDAAYHQGTVWAWLAGPFVDAWLRQHPQDLEVPRWLLAGLLEHLQDGGVGSISEVFDAEAPFTPRGCIAQAWSIAEALRIALRLALPGTAGPGGTGAPPSQRSSG